MSKGLATLQTDRKYYFGQSADPVFGMYMYRYGCTLIVYTDMHVYVYMHASYIIYVPYDICILCIDLISIN